MSRLIRLILFTVIGLLFFLYLYYGENDILPKIGADFSLYLVTILVSLSAGFGIDIINKMLNRKLGWRKSIFLRFSSGLALNFVWVITILLLAAWIGNLTQLVAIKIFEAEFINNELELKLIILSVLGLFIFNLVEFVTYSYSEYSVGQIRKLRAERKQLEFQFEALKSQLSPHYLFNSMNTISSLIYRDPHIAENFIRNLADTFNYVLHTKDVKLVTLKEELEALKDFNYLLRIRYAEAVNLQIDIPKELLSSPIPPLTLQLLIENAVKHNIVTDEEPLKINVRHEGRKLIILNNKTGSPSNTSSHKVGLENIRKRYAFFTPHDIKVIDEDYFQVELPLLTD
jgi:two-component system, LytTR family, sensor kinase